MTTNKDIQWFWTCPHCGQFQDDVYNPVQGPAINATCGMCLESTDIDRLDIDSQHSHHKAVEAAK